MLNLFKKFTISRIPYGGQFVSAAIHTSAALPYHRKDYSKEPKKDEGTQGELSIDIDDLVASTTKDDKESLFPDRNTPDRLFNGVPFKELPICTINSTKNNTKVAFTDYQGKNMVLNTCGMEGFKNCRKGTNIAAQATALTACAKALALGVTEIRLVLKGFGPGRLSAAKGLQMGGMTVISVTDLTPISYNPPRPRKARRV